MERRNLPQVEGIGIVWKNGEEHCFGCVVREPTKGVRAFQWGLAKAVQYGIYSL